MDQNRSARSVPTEQMANPALKSVATIDVRPVTVVVTPIVVATSVGAVIAVVAVITVVTVITVAVRIRIIVLRISVVITVVVNAIVPLVIALLMSEIAALLVLITSHVAPLMPITSLSVGRYRKPSTMAATNASEPAIFVRPLKLNCIFVSLVVDKSRRDLHRRRMQAMFRVPPGDETSLSQVFDLKKCLIRIVQPKTLHYHSF